MHTVVCLVIPIMNTSVLRRMHTATLVREHPCLYAIIQIIVYMLLFKF